MDFKQFRVVAVFCGFATAVALDKTRILLQLKILLCGYCIVGSYLTVLMA